MKHRTLCVKAPIPATLADAKDTAPCRWAAIRIALGFTILMATLTGCALMPFCADGRMFDKHAVPNIVEHRTTRQEIAELFGDPLETNDSDIQKATFWRYRYVYLGALTVQRADLGLYFMNDTVVRYEFSEDERRY